VLARTQTKEEYGNLHAFLFGIHVAGWFAHAAILEPFTVYGSVDIADACLLIYG